MIDFERLFEEQAPRLIEVAASIVGTRADAEDVVQEAFVSAYRSRESFRGDARASTWLRRIVINEALEHRRRSRVRSGRPAGTAPGVQIGAIAPDERPAETPGPAATASAQERALAVRRAIDALPEEQRAVVVLRELEGLGFREIAELLGLPLGTVESRVIRARERLKLALRRHLVDDRERQEKE